MESEATFIPTTVDHWDERNESDSNEAEFSIFILVGILRVSTGYTPIKFRFEAERKQIKIHFFG